MTDGKDLAWNDDTFMYNREGAEIEDCVAHHYSGSQDSKIAMTSCDYDDFYPMICELKMNVSDAQMLMDNIIALGKFGSVEIMKQA